MMKPALLGFLIGFLFNAQSAHADPDPPNIKSYPENLSNVLLPKPKKASKTYVLLVIGSNDAHIQASEGTAISNLIRLGIPEDQTFIVSNSGNKYGQTRSVSPENVRQSIQKIGKLAGPNDQILIVINTHGSRQGESSLEESNQTTRTVDGKLWDQWLDQSIHEKTQTTVVLSTCYAAQAGRHLRGPNRLILHSSRTTNLSLGDVGSGNWFLLNFWKALNFGAHNAVSSNTDMNLDGVISYREAFEFARNRTKRGDVFGGTILGDHRLDAGIGHPRLETKKATEERRAKEHLQRIAQYGYDPFASCIHPEHHQVSSRLSLLHDPKVSDRKQKQVKETPAFAGARAGARAGAGPRSGSAL